MTKVPSPDERPFCRSLWVWTGSAAVIALFFAVLRRPPDGIEHGTLAQFFGRFHPLLVHIPIALILLVPLLEIAGSFPRGIHLRSAAGFVLGLAAAAAIGAALDGWLLAWSGGYGGRTVVRHLWGGVSLAALAFAATGIRRLSLGRPLWALTYRLLLVSMVFLLVWTSDQGAALTHGETFLTQYMPDGLRLFLGVAKPRQKPVQAITSARPATFYTVRIVPILERNCITCHGPQKVKGGLRLDSYLGIIKGGEDGPVIIPWMPLKSDLYRRITLPPDDDDSMPSGGKKSLPPDDVKLIQQWIAAGASDHQPSD